jgi:hypothetical protein
MRGEGSFFHLLGRNCLIFLFIIIFVSDDSYQCVIGAMILKDFVGFWLTTTILAIVFG